jgi:hypothetical protein
MDPRSISVEDVLANSLPAPYDLPSFRAFCESSFCEENLDFALACLDILRESNAETAQTHTLLLLNRFVKESARDQVNISGKVKNEFARLEKDINEVSVEEVHEVVHLAFVEVSALLQHETLIRYVRRIDVATRILRYQNNALWWKKAQSCGEFFKFPETLNTIHVRTHAFCAVVLVIANVLIQWFFGFPWLSLYIVYGYLARIICGPKLDPQSLFVVFVARPLLEDVLKIAESSFVPGPPKRFAQFVGLCFSATATALQFFGNIYASISAWGMLVAASSLVVLFDLCLACVMWNMSMRLLKKEECQPCKSVNVRSAHKLSSVFASTASSSPSSDAATPFRKYSTEQP